MKEQLRTEAEKVLNKHIFNKFDEADINSFINAMLDFHAQQSKERDELHGILDFLTNENSKYSIMYGNQKERFADNDREYTISEIIEIYLTTLTK